VRSCIVALVDESPSCQYLQLKYDFSSLRIRLREIEIEIDEIEIAICSSSLYGSLSIEVGR